MRSFRECIDEYRAHVVKGAIRVAFMGLMGNLMSVRSIES